MFCKKMLCSIVVGLTLIVPTEAQSQSVPTYRAMLLPAGLQANDINSTSVAGSLKASPIRGVIYNIMGDSPGMEYYCPTQMDTNITVLPEGGSQAYGVYKDAQGVWEGGVFPLSGSQGPSEYNPGPYIRPIIPLATSQRSGVARSPQPPVTETGVVPLNGGPSGAVYRSDSLEGFDFFHLAGYGQVTGISTCAAEDGSVGVNADSGHAYVWGKSQIDDLGPNSVVNGIEPSESQYRVGQKGGYATLWVGTTAYVLEPSYGSYANWMLGGVIVGGGPNGAFVYFLNIQRSVVEGYYLSDITLGLPKGTKVVTATRVAYNGRILADCVVPTPGGVAEQWAVLSPTIPPPL